MQQDLITFELPTHQLPKVALRLECLLNTLIQAIEEPHPLVHHYALNNILEIIKLIEKPELKSRFLKEMIRIEHQLLKNEHAIDEHLQNRLNVQIHYLNHAAGRFAKVVRSDPFLQSIRPIQSSHNADCELHSPQLLLWLKAEPEQRQEHLNTWFSHLRPLYDTVAIYLSILRATAFYEMIEAQHGFYQRALPPKTQCHLILLRLYRASSVIPRMQLGHYGFSLRLYDAHSLQEIHEGQTIPLSLALCKL